MSDTQKCSLCGAPNELNRLYCMKCGAKLNLERVERQLQQSVGRQRAASFFRRLIRMGILLGLATVLGLLLWPSPSVGELGQRTDADLYRLKASALLDAIKAQSAEQVQISEREINAYLAETVQSSQPTNAPSLVELRVAKVSLMFRKEHLHLYICGVRGPVQLSYEFELVPSIQNGTLQFEICRVRWGHLKFPSFVGPWLLSRISPLFMQMKQERYVLSHLSALESDDGIVRLTVGRK